MTPTANNNLNKAYVDDENILANGGLTDSGESGQKPNIATSENPPTEPCDRPNGQTNGNGVLYTKGTEVSQFNLISMTTASSAVFVWLEFTHLQPQCAF